MSLLIVQDVKKHYGAQEVLAGASLRIDPGEKVGVVGRNGGGKSTLLRLIEGLDQPDWGTVNLRKGARLGHVPQRPTFSAGETPLGYVEGGLEESRAVMRELERLGAEMGEAREEDLARLLTQHEEATRRLETLGGWDLSRRVETVLSGIGLRRDLWEREANTLSGGEKSRVALARELIAGHDLLLLDEPTNHLDLDGIEWIESWLRELRTSVLIVSHDRRLLDNAVGTIFELERGRIERYPGNYSRYLTLKAERFESELRAWEQQQDYLRKEEAFIKKHMGSQRTAEAKGRQKKLSHVERLERPAHDVRRPVIRLKATARGGEMVLKTEDLAVGYGDKPILRDVNLRIGRGMRVGVIGANGSGKTTLLRALAGRSVPLTGKLELGHGAACGYFDQDSGGLREDGTPYSEIRRHHGDLTDLQIRDHLARFLFRGDEVEKSVSALSGGERARLRLAQLVLTKPSWLALDEPTNHLDLASRTALEEFLGTFEGTLVCISHDRAFLDALCTDLIVVSGGCVREFAGNYSEWRRTLDEELAAESAQRQLALERKRDAERRQREQVQSTADPSGTAKGSRKNPYKLKKVEERIIALEAELTALHAAMAEESVYRDHDKLRELQYRLAEVERDLEQANGEWESFV